MEPSQDLALSIINSSEEFSIPFQSAYVWIGYAKKQNAKNKLVKNFQKGIDYEVFTDPRVNSKQKGLQGGRPAEEISQKF